MEEKIKKANIDNYSLASYYVEAKYNDDLLGNATCFFYKQETKFYLVTNWHVVTGKDPITNQILSPSGKTPNLLSVRIFINDKNNLIGWKFYNVQLYDPEERPLWFEYNKFKQRTDVIIIPIEIPDNLKVYCINEIEEPFNESTEALIGQDLFILGYPFGISRGAGFPIWKRASVASEPYLDMDNLPKIYLDTASRPGMSGSPVVIKEKRTVTLINKGENVSSRYYTKFVGVYSGRIVAEDVFEAQLGILWKRKIIDEIIIQHKE